MNVLMMERKPTPEKYCQHCGKKMDRKRMGNRLESMNEFKKRRFCSIRCYGDWMIAHAGTITKHAARKRAQRAIEMKQCQRCGRTNLKLNRHHADHQKALDVMVLCTECHAIVDQKLGNRLTKKTSICVICGGEFLPKDSHPHKTCSEKCFSELGRRNANKRWRTHGQTGGKMEFRE